MGLPGGSNEKNPPAMQKTQVCSLDWEDPLEKGTAAHSSILAWRIPWTVLYHSFGCKEADTTEQLSLSSSHFSTNSVELEPCDLMGYVGVQ